MYVTMMKYVIYKLLYNIEYLIVYVYVIPWLCEKYELLSSESIIFVIMCYLYCVSFCVMSSKI